MKSYKADIQREETKTLHVYLFLLMLTDFLLTYIGIQYGFIEEGNPLMVWLFHLPLLFSLAFRAVYSLFIIFLSKVLSDVKYVYHYYFIRFALIINSIIAMLHFRWIYYYVHSLL